MLDNKFKIVCIEVSGGGYEALELFIGTLRDDSNMAYVVAQDLEANKPNKLIGLLSKSTNIPISIVEDGKIPQKNNIYIYPLDKDIKITEDRFRLTIPSSSIIYKSPQNQLLDNVIHLIFMANINDVDNQKLNYYTNQTLYDMKKELLSRKQKLKSINKELQKSNTELKEYKDSLEKIVEVRTQKLEQSKNDIENLLDSINSIIIVSRNGTKLVKVNKEFFNFFNEFNNIQEFFKSHDCVCDLFEVCDDDGFIYKEKAFRANYQSWIDYIIDSKRPSYKAKIIRDGKTFIFNIKITILSYDKDDVYYVIFMNDITILHEYHISLERQVEEEIQKRIEKDKFLIQQSKLASMGEMIGNIAHQWRQPLNQLSLINITLDTLIRKDKLSLERFEKYFEQTDNTIQSMSQTINDFRNFFHPEKEISAFTISSIFDESLKFLKEGLIRHDISIDIGDYNDYMIKGHKNELVQVLLNLINNSKDAIVSKNIKNGKISITVKKDKKIEIIIEDNGGGIEDEIIHKVFEPYFTTKFKEEGTGIGMYMSKMIVEQSMEGTLSIENKNDGVLVTITLPLG